MTTSGVELRFIDKLKNKFDGLHEELKSMLGIIVLILLLLPYGGGCAKKKNDISTVSTDAYLAKADLTGCPPGKEDASCQKTFSAVQTIVGANEELDSASVTPGTHVDYGQIKFQITQDELRVVRTGELNRDGDKATLVAAYPITSHFDILRDKNDFGEDTNKIIEDQKAPWDQRQYIRVDWSTNKVTSTQLPNVFGTEINVENSRVVTPLKKDGGMLSFDTDATITQTDSFMLEDGSVTSWSPGAMRAHLKNVFLEIKPSDYKAYEMPNTEFARFGFFRTYENFVNPDKGVTVSGAKEYANRFNVCESGANTSGKSCSTNKIVYYLNAGFPDEYKQAARDVVASWNKSFQKALDRSDDIVVLDESKQPEVGDVRYNIINGVDQAVPTGLLGIMQNVTNFNSGETLSGMASVYLATVRYEAEIAGEQFDLLTKNGGPFSTQGKVPGASSLNLISSKMSGTATNLVKEIKNRSRVLGIGNYKADPSLSRVDAQTIQSVYRQIKVSQGEAVARHESMLNSMVNRLDVSDPGLSATKQALSHDEQKQYDFKNLLSNSRLQSIDRMKALSYAEKGIETIEAAPSIDPAIQLFVWKFITSHVGEPLDQMKADLMKQVRYMVFYSTLIHEMGHTFGLRHNFAGSGDINNYTDNYKQLEKQKQALMAANPFDPKITELSLQEESYDFASVMDYAGNFFEAQGGTGPYDDAAIRFAYNSSIDKAKDPIVGLAKGYKFCTDHQVGEDLLCQRFDKGNNSSLTMAHLIDYYNQAYSLRNFRRDRALFGNQLAYFRRMLINTFLPARQVTDEFLYQFITSPQVAASGTQCNIGFLKDSVDAGEVANLCDPAVVANYQQIGLTFSDWSSLVVLLLKDDFSGMRKAPSSYKPNGFADLLFSNYLASQFFQQVLGTPEPGLYLALGDALGNVNLNLLPQAAGGEDGQIKAYLIGLGLSDDQASALVPQLRGQLVDMSAGPNAKYLMSRIGQDGSFQRVDVIGHIWDKLAAIVIMGARGLPVQKYQQISLNTNMFFSPQTKTLTTALFNALITNSNSIAVETVTTRGGDTVDASVPAALSLDTKTYGLILAISDLISDQNPDFASKLRVCLGNEPTCSDSLFKLPTVSFWDKDGVTQYKSIQTLTNDSISFNIVSKGDGLSKQRIQAAQDMQNKDQLIAQMNSEIKGSKPGEGAPDHQKALMTLIRKSPDLAKSLASVFGAGKEGGSQPSLWQRIMDQAGQLDSVDPNVLQAEGDEIKKKSASAEAAITKAFAGDAATLALAQAASAMVEKEMKDVNSLSFRVVAAPYIFQNATDSLGTIEADARMIRNIMQIMGSQ